MRRSAKILSILIVGGLLTFSLSLLAQEQRTYVQDGETIDSEKLVILTHPCPYFDGCMEVDNIPLAQKGVDKLATFANEHDIPVITLENCRAHSEGHEYQCAPYVHPTPNLLYHLSAGGEFRFLFRANKIYIAGGYFRWCVMTTLEYVYRAFFNRNELRELNIYFPVEAIFDIDQLRTSGWIVNQHLLLKDQLTPAVNEGRLVQWAWAWLIDRAYFLHSDESLDVHIYKDDELIVHRPSHALSVKNIHIHFVDQNYE